MKLRKRFISAFLSLCMVISLASVAVSAQEEEEISYATSEYITFSNSDDDNIGEIVEDLYEAKMTVISGLESLQRKIDVRGMGVTRDVVQDFYMSILFDNPQFFYVFTYLKYGYVGDEVLYIYPQYITSDKKPGEDTEQEIAQQNIEIGKMQEAFDRNTQQLLSSVDESMTDEEKLLALHDALVCHVSYSKESTGKYINSIYTAYGAIVEGAGVCQSYALAYECLARLAGIQDIHLVSNTIHSWNMVKLDGNWYHIDATFDDPVSDVNGRVLHKYFLISDKKLSENDKSGSHGTWAPNYSAESTKYDSGDYYWLNTESQVIFDGGKTYYVDMSSNTSAGSKMGIITQIDERGKKTQLAKTEDLWSAGTGFYAGNYTRLFKEGDCLYFNNSTTVMRVNVNDYKQEVVYTLPDDIKESNCIYGLKKGDNKIYIGYGKTPTSVMTTVEYKYDFNIGLVPKYEMGDVNHDNILSIADVTAVQSYIAGNNVEIDISLADMDKDSLITIGDCTAIQKIIAGMAA